MKLKKGKINLAYAILLLVESELESMETDKDGYIRVFDNCREQGFKIHLSGAVRKQMTIAFSEHRSSDNIVVYHSMKYEEDTDFTSEEFWNSAKHFSYNEPYQASEYIVQLIKDM